MHCGGSIFDFCKQKHVFPTLWACPATPTTPTQHRILRVIDFYNVFGRVKRVGGSGAPPPLCPLHFSKVSFSFEKCGSSVFIKKIFFVVKKENGRCVWGLAPMPRKEPTEGADTIGVSTVYTVRAQMRLHVYVYVL